MIGSLLSNPRKLITFVVAYWLITSVAFAAFVGLQAMNSDNNFADVFSQSLTALGAVFASCNVLFAGLLYYVRYSAPWVQRVSIVALIQQILPMNIIGIVLLGLLIWSTRKHREFVGDFLPDEPQSQVKEIHSGRKRKGSEQAMAISDNAFTMDPTKANAPLLYTLLGFLTLITLMMAVAVFNYLF